MSALKHPLMTDERIVRDQVGHDEGRNHRSQQKEEVDRVLGGSKYSVQGFLHDLLRGSGRAHSDACS